MRDTSSKMMPITPMARPQPNTPRNNTKRQIPPCLILSHLANLNCRMSLIRLTTQAHPQPPGVTVERKEAAMTNPGPLLVAGAAAVGCSALLGIFVLIAWVRRQYHCYRRQEKAEGIRWMVEFLNAEVLAYTNPQLTSESKHPLSATPLWIREIPGLSQAREHVLVGYQQWLEARPNAIRLLWRILRDRVFRMVCSYKRVTMPNDSSSPTAAGRDGGAQGGRHD